MEYDLLTKTHIENRKKLFVRFLKENNCYKQFLLYMNIDKFNNINKLVEFSEINSTNEFSIAFRWERTAQKHNYWMELAIKWKKCNTKFILENY